KESGGDPPGAEHAPPQHTPVCRHAPTLLNRFRSGVGRSGHPSSSPGCPSSTTKDARVGRGARGEVTDGPERQSVCHSSGVTKHRAWPRCSLTNRRGGLAASRACPCAPRSCPSWLLLSVVPAYPVPTVAESGSA